MGQTTRKKFKNAGFTLLEMLIVLFVITLLVLLFVPSLTKQRENIQKQGAKALEKVIETQVELFRLDYGKEHLITWEILVTEGYLTAEQVTEARDQGVTID